jgi:hypothetical protein
MLGGVEYEIGTRLSSNRISTSFIAICTVSTHIHRLFLFLGSILSLCRSLCLIVCDSDSWTHCLTVTVVSMLYFTAHFDLLPHIEFH